MLTYADDPRQQLHVDAADEAVLRMLTYADAADEAVLRCDLCVRMLLLLVCPHTATDVSAYCCNQCVFPYCSQGNSYMHTYIRMCACAYAYVGVGVGVGVGVRATRRSFSLAKIITRKS